MPNGKDSPPTPEQIRQQVDQIMDRWQSYPSFAALLNALMEANGLTNAELARQLNRDGRKTFSERLFQNLCRAMCMKLK